MQPKAALRGPPVYATRLIRHCVRDVVNGKDRPLARSPSLRELRRRLRADFVHPLRRYYEIVRLPRNVHAGRTAIAFSGRPLPLSAREFLGSPGSRAWSVHACSGSQTPRCPEAARVNVAPGVAFPLSGLGRHTGLVISELNGWPACAPVNASPMTLRPSAHDSEAKLVR